VKRSKVVEIIASWVKPEILCDVYDCNHEEWADNLLYTLETELGFCPVKIDSYGNLESLDYDKE
jgi:hypothetical protein